MSSPRSLSQKGSLWRRNCPWSMPEFEPTSDGRYRYHERELCPLIFTCPPQLQVSEPVIHLTLRENFLPISFPQKLDTVKSVAHSALGTRQHYFIARGRSYLCKAFIADFFSPCTGQARAQDPAMDRYVVTSQDWSNEYEALLRPSSDASIVN
jgi:hypothetical protein